MVPLARALALTLLAVSACSTPADDDSARRGDASLATVGATVARWHLARSGDAERGDAFLLPWPNDLAREATGGVDLDAFPHEGVHTLVRQYLQTFDGRLDGFSLQGAIYFRFTGPIAEQSLPDSLPRTLDAASSVQLINVDPSSPELGRRTPARWYFRARGTRYWQDHTLAVAPAPGHPLRPRTRYAAVLTTDLRSADGTAVARDRDLDAVLAGAGGDGPIAAARTIYVPVAEALSRAGVPTSRVLSLAVFTTQDPVSEFFRAADRARAETPTPSLEGSLSAPEDGEFFTTLRGHYGPSANFQSGESPYNEMGSGGFVLDDGGVPIAQRMERIRFTLTIPRGEMPPGGFPVAIYAHGTGGDADSFVQDGTAGSLAAQGIATLGFDQVFHGERAPSGTTPDLAFFNFGNPTAGRTNNRQAALDLIQCGRFVRALRTSYTREGQQVPLRFDGERVYFFGHSQGGLNGPLWLAAEDGARAAVLSGAAGNLAISLVEKRLPVNLPALLTSLLQLERESAEAPAELTALHPIATLLQLIVDPADPVSYGRYIVREPRPGNRRKHVFQTQGFVDSYAPPAGIAALALSIGLPLAQPVLHEEPGWSLFGAISPALPLRANEDGVTAAWMQFDAPRGVDGHFVIFRVRGAQGRASRFLGSAARAEDGVPTLPDAL